jgi:hypothetical protein
MGTDNAIKSRTGALPSALSAVGALYVGAWPLSNINHTDAQAHLLGALLTVW